MARARWVASLGLALALWLSSPPVFADAAFDAGVKLYAAKNYRAAAQQFEKAMQTSPGNANAIYYCALSHYSSNSGARARQLFQYLVTNFGSTQQGQMARSVLAKMPAVGSSASSGASSSSSSAVSSAAADDDDDANDKDGTARWLKSHSSASEMASLPSEARIPFRNVRNTMFVDVMINGQPIAMVVDTGAPMTVIGDNHMAALGLTRPAQAGKIQGRTGVGDRQHDMRWTQNCDLKCAGIYRKNFPLTIQDDLPTDPLLGQTFFAPYTVTMDVNNSVIILKKKGTGGARSATGARDPWSIPFKWSGGHMIVDAQINGRQGEMIFDTGANCYASFSHAMLKKFNIEIPANYRGGLVQGTGGLTNSYNFPIDSIKLGPISVSDPVVSVVDGSNMDRPLLGMEFFGGYSYTIDSDAKLIHFKRQ